MQILKFLSFYSKLTLAGLWFLFSCWVGLCILPFRWKDPGLAALFSRIVHWGARRILKVEVEVTNEKGLYLHQPCMYVCNHQSNIDIFTITSFYPYRTAIIGKKEITWIPLFGLFFIGSGNILIDRKNRAHSLGGLDRAKDYILKNNMSVWMFPEGTRNGGVKTLLPFKKGAFHIAISAKIPVIPVVHEPLEHYFSKKDLRLGGRIRVQVLDPIPTDSYTLEDVAKLSDLARSRIQEKLNLMS